MAQFTPGSIAERLQVELGEEPKKTGPRKTLAANGNGEPSMFGLANGVDTVVLLDRLGIEHDEKYATCPGCTNEGALIGENGGLKCLHDTCKGVGPAGFTGFRNPVGLVETVKGLEPKDAARWICESFGIPIPERKQSNDTTADAPPDPHADAPDIDPLEPPTAGNQVDDVNMNSEPTEKNGGPGPTADEPLRGLTSLAAVALNGRDRILSLASTAVVYLWQDIAVEGTIVLIAGPPAEGKTTLLFMILVARASRGEAISLLGRRVEPAAAGKFIVLIEGEHSEASTARKLVKFFRLLEVDDAGLDRVIIVARKAVRLGSPEWLDVVTLSAAGLVSDIAIDTVARVAPADANDEREQVAIYDQVAQAIEKAPDGADKPVVWCVSHTRKNNTDGGLADVSGSAQRTGQADSVLMIKGEKVDGRTVSTKVVFQKLREDPDDYPMPVTFTVTADGVKLTDGATASDNRPLETRIVEALRVEPRTKTALATLLGRNNADVDDAIKNLFSVRAITTKGVKVGGRDRKAFVLRPGGAWGAPDEAPDEPITRLAPDEHPTNHEPA